MTYPKFDQSRTAWITKGFEQLVAAHAATPVIYDVLIVGSGYGGAVAADTLTQHRKNGRRLRVCILERGNEYLPGSFPANSTELPAHIRFGRNKSGLFDFRAGADVATLVANGVGGGSLINAGVMKRARPGVFERHWPENLSDITVLEPFYTGAASLLGSTIGGAYAGGDNTVDRSPNGVTLPKVAAIMSLGTGENFQPAPLTIANTDRVNSGRVMLSACKRCGDCATGCNYHAKDSLDTNLLCRAYRRGAEIYSGATVLRVEQDEGSGWRVHAVFTDSRLRELHQPTVLLAEHVILAAGTLGSTEILKQSEAGGLHCSRMLGQRCSTNGDTLIVHFDTNEVVNAVGHESDGPDDRNVGPTISGIVDFREHPDPEFHGLLIEEMASPASLRRVFGELYATVNTIHRLGDRDRTVHVEGFPEDDIYELKDGQIDRSALYAIMGDDGAHGEIELADPQTDGTARICWPGIAHLPLFDRQVRAFTALTEGHGGQVIPNPLWELLPEKVALLTGVARGPVVTVHPLGGCAMADTGTDGVVNDVGQVFSEDDSASVYAGLVVLDGSIIPSALSVNPALTISAVALRAAFALATLWDYEPETGAWQPATGEAPLAAEQENWVAAARPTYRDASPPFVPSPTMIRITERMSGRVSLVGDSGEARDWIVELTLRFDEKSLRQLAQPSRGKRNAVLTVQTASVDPVVRSMVRLFVPRDFEEAHQCRRPARELEESLNLAAIFHSDIKEGTLTLFERQPSHWLARVIRSGWAWLRNDGIRDFWEYLFGTDSADSSAHAHLLRSGIALASRAGERRTLIYKLTLGTPVPPAIGGGAGADSKLYGEKHFTYGRCSNPWNQLMELELTRFPGLADGRARRMLSLDLAFLARIRIPLLEITRQNDGVTALADLGSFLAYVGRLMVGMHSWNFRAPDAQTETRPPRRLPGPLPGMPYPEIHTLFIAREKPYWSERDDADPDAVVPGYVRLTRYRASGTGKCPLVMMHGYSASGTTFAHPAVKDNFADWFHHKGRDVWIVDFRSSCGMRTAREGWSFEQIAYRDIPEAVRFICNETGQEQVDIIAHCMGAAMLSMAILHNVRPDSPILNYDALDRLRKRIRRIAVTQITPLMVLSPINIFRGYVFQYFRELLPGRYEFNPGNDATPDDQLLDRLLSTLPYPPDEYHREHPASPCKRTPWTRTRHRMDALYGRAFNTKHMNDEVLRHIDDFFGPMSMDTVAQTINFARYNMITDVNGRNMFVSRDSLANRWGRIPLLNINAEENGLADYRTMRRTEEIFQDAGRSFRGKTIPDAGHQDCLIGDEPRRKTLEHIQRFFEAEVGEGASPVNEDDDTLIKPVRPPNKTFVAYTPWIGPVVTREPSGEPSFRIGSHPTNRVTEGVLMFRVKASNGLILRSDGGRFTGDEDDRQHLLSSAYFITDMPLRSQHWTKLLFPRADGGDAWLILLVYNDSEMLRETNTDIYSQVLVRIGGAEVPYFVGAGAGPRAWNIERADIRHLIVEGTLLPRRYPKKFVDAALRVLRQQPGSNDNVGGDPNAAVAQPAASDTSFESGPAVEQLNDNPTFEPKAVPASAVVDRLVDERFDLRDGLVPDLPARQPPNTCDFSLASCQYPGGFVDGSVAYMSYRAAETRIAARNAEGSSNIVPRFAIFTGDQIYADASAGLFDPSVRTGRFELPYHAWLRFPYVRSVLRRIPSFMLPDDHEIEDNWEPLPGDTANTALMEAGRKGYDKYQRGLDRSSTPPAPSLPLHFTFEMDGLHFWMADTRTERQPRTVDGVSSTGLFAEATWARIETWLTDLKDPGRPKFIVTPAMLLPRHRHAAQWNAPESSLRSDGWDGYPASLFRLLKLLVDGSHRNVVFLSGDEHLPCLARVKVTKGNNSITLYSVHTAASYAPFPFANASAAALIPAEKIHFNVATDGAVEFTSEQMSVCGPGPVSGTWDYSCEVNALYPEPGDSMTYIRVKNQNGTWKMRCEFAANVIDVEDLNDAMPLMSPLI